MTDEQMMEEFHQALRVHIKKQGVSIEKWANQSGLTSSTVNSLFSTRRSPGFKTIRGIASNADSKLLTVMATYLFGRKVNVEFRDEKESKSSLSIVADENKVVTDTETLYELHKLLSRLVNDLESGINDLESEIEDLNNDR